MELLQVSGWNAGIRMILVDIQSRAISDSNLSRNGHLWSYPRQIILG